MLIASVFVSFPSHSRNSPLRRRGSFRLSSRRFMRYSRLMGSPWRTMCLRELCTLRAGSAFKESYQGRTSGELPFIKVSDMNLPSNWRWIQDAANWVSRDDADAMRARGFPEDTIVFAKI